MAKKTAVTPTAEEVVTELNDTTVITIAMLKAKNACADGFKWVKRNLPKGAPYGEFIRALEADGQTQWADWLIGNFGASIIASKWRIQEILDATDPAKVKSSGGASGDSTKIGASGHSTKIGASGDYTQIGASGHSTQIGASGDSTKIGASGDYTKIGASGDSTQIGASGDSTKIGASGHSTQIGASGHSTQIGASGDSTQIGASGDYTQIGASGRKSIVAAVGDNSIGKVGDDGCLALAWTDKSGRPRLSVGYAGENLKANVWYHLDSKGEFVEVPA